MRKLLSEKKRDGKKKKMFKISQREDTITDYPETNVTLVEKSSGQQRFFWSSIILKPQV